MQEQGVDLRRFFDANVPQELQRELLRIVYLADRDGYKEVKDHNYHERVIPDLLPHVQRGRLETYAADLKRKFPDLNVSYEWNSKNTATHVAVTSGKVTVTFSSVTDPLTIVRNAEFRNEKAEAQGKLFTLDDDNHMIFHEPVDQSLGRLYAIIIHHAAKANLSIPAFVDVVFPNHDCSAYIDRIHLMERYQKEIGMNTKGVEVITENGIEVIKEVVSTEESMPLPKDTDR